MKKLPVLWLIGLAVVLAACAGDEQSSASPTPSVVPLGDFSEAAASPQQVTIPILAQSPAAYAGQLVEIEGQLRFRPRLVCSDETWESPASWQLVAGDTPVFVGGFDEQVRLLLPEALTMQVMGQWTFWQGQVGCGPDAPEEQFYYLNVTDILSPSPLVNVTLTPQAPPPIDSGTAVAEGGGSSNNAESGITPTNASTREATPSTRTDTQPNSTPLPGATSTATAVPTATSAGPTPTPSKSATPGPTSTANIPGPGTPAATATPTTLPPSATPTTPPGNITATPTATQPPTFTLTNQGSIEAEAFAAGILKPFEIHSFSFEIEDEDEVTITAAGEPGLNLVVSIVGDSGTPILVMDNQPESGIERIENAALLPGSYTVQVRGSSGEAGNYLVMLLFSESFDYTFVDLIEYGQQVSEATEEENDHFWLFYGEAGDVVTITAVPTNQGDLFLELYDPGGENISDFVDDGLEGEPETLSGFRLPDTGLFAVRIGEYEFNPMTYQLVVTLD